MAKVVCVLYDDPVDGYPKTYARDGVPKLDKYPGGQTMPTPKAIDFTPGALLGSVSGALGLRKYLEGAGHTLVVTSDKDGPNSVFEREIVDAEIVISQPFWPAYLTKERIAKAPKLKMAITAGIGSDHVDLAAAMERGITVAEVTYCNSISVAEHVVMMILGLVRNYIPSYQWVVKGGWNIADCVARSYDVEGMTVGTVAAGRIGLAVLRRLKPFDMKLHYTDRHRLPDAVEKELGLTFHKSAADMVPHCDVVTINAPLHPETENLFNDKLIATMKRGAYLINTARGKIANRDAVVAALRSGQLAGYAGDVWFPQPAPQDHPWRTMPHHGMTPHISGSSLSAQARYAAGTREILECWFEKRPIRSSTAASSPAPAPIPTAPATPRAVPRRRRNSKSSEADDASGRPRAAKTARRRLVRRTPRQDHRRVRGRGGRIACRRPTGRPARRTVRTDAVDAHRPHRRRWRRRHHGGDEGPRLREGRSPRLDRPRRILARVSQGDSGRRGGPALLGERRVADRPHAEPACAGGPHEHPPGGNEPRMVRRRR
jgi:formate dehydrogenase